MLASKIIATFLLPPGVLILLLCVGLIYRRYVIGTMLCVTGVILLILFSMAPVRDAILVPLENAYPPLSSVQDVPVSSAIVLLGGGVDERSPEYQGRDILGTAALRRTMYAAHLAKGTNRVVYVTGGVVLANDQEPEASIMQRQLLELGILPHRIVPESTSRTTWENAKNLAPILREAKVETIVLVTSATHMPRSVWCFEQFGFEVIAAPTDYLQERGAYHVLDYLPDADALSDVSRALHECLGMFWYRLRYRVD